MSETNEQVKINTETPEKQIEKKTDQNNIAKQVLFVIILLSVIYIIYYSYKQFIKNSKIKNNSKNNKHTKEDETENDQEEEFDLKEALNSLYRKQKNIINSIMAK
jgi:uncharacterized protein HemX